MAMYEHSEQSVEDGGGPLDSSLGTLGFSTTGGFGQTIQSQLSSSFVEEQARGYPQKKGVTIKENLAPGAENLQSTTGATSSTTAGKAKNYWDVLTKNHVDPEDVDVTNWQRNFYLPRLLALGEHAEIKDQKMLQLSKSMTTSQVHDCICMLHLHVAPACCILHVACCLLHAARCMRHLHATCCMLYPAYYICILRLHVGYAYCICTLQLASCTLHVAPCMLHVACSILHAACCMLHVACCMLHAASCMLYAACCVLFIACRTLHIASNCMLGVAYYMLHSAPALEVHDDVAGPEHRAGRQAGGYGPGPREEEGK